MYSFRLPLPLPPTAFGEGPNWFSLEASFKISSGAIPYFFNTFCCISRYVCRYILNSVFTKSSKLIIIPPCFIRENTSALAGAEDLPSLVIKAAALMCGSPHVMPLVTINYYLLFCCLDELEKNLTG